MSSSIPNAMDVLLLSNSTNAGEALLAHAAAEIARVAGGNPIVFLPFALEDWDGYTESIRRALPDLEIHGAHEFPRLDDAILAARCVFLGGGNTFRLLATLQRLDLLDALRGRVETGQCSYIGSSAGTNVAGPSIRTTNDMPIVETVSLRALHLVPFQLNPHFTDATIPNLAAETRAERIAQFHEHSTAPVVALYEGAWLRVAGGSAIVEGPTGSVAAKVFQPGVTHVLHAGDTVASWWVRSAFDDLPAHLTTLANSPHW